MISLALPLNKVEMSFALGGKTKRLPPLQANAKRFGTALSPVWLLRILGNRSKNLLDLRHGSPPEEWMREAACRMGGISTVAENRHPFKTITLRIWLRLRTSPESLLGLSDRHGLV